MSSRDPYHDTGGVIPHACEICQEELTLTHNEKQAFEEFANRIQELSTTSTLSVVSAQGNTESSPSSLDSVQTTGGTSDVREAYRETVMSVPHYEEVYGEALAENVSEELNPEIAAILENGTPLTQEIRQYTNALAHEAQAQREQFSETITNETQSLETAEQELHAIESALEEMNERILSEQSYTELERVWEQLDGLQDRTEAVSKERQERVHAIVVDTHSNDPITLQTYLYQSLSTSFPVLSECTDMLRKILMAKSSVIDSFTRRV